MGLGALVLAGGVVALRIRSSPPEEDELSFPVPDEPRPPAGGPGSAEPPRRQPSGAPRPPDGLGNIPGLEELGIAGDWVRKVRARGSVPPPGSPGNSRFLKELAELIRKDPSVVKSLVALVKYDRSLSYEGRCLVAEAIVEGSEPARAYEVLAELIRDPSLEPEIKTAVVETVGWPKAPPDAGVVKALEELSRGSDPGLAHLATEHLGRAARRLKDHDPARAAAILEAFLTDYERAEREGDEKRLTAVLAGGAESKDPRFEPLLRKGLAHSNPEVRRSAVLSFGRLDPPDRFETVLNVFTTDPDLHVRISALSALEAVPGEPPPLQDRHVSRIPLHVHERLASALANDPAFRIRQHILMYWQRCFSGQDAIAPGVVREAVSRAAQYDPWPGVRSMAEETLKYRRGFLDRPR